MSFDGISTLDDVEVRGKTVLVRVDFNSSIDETSGKLEPNQRFDAHAITVNELCNAGAKVVLLAHQGRAGDKDFTTLEQHSQLFAEKLGRKVEFIADIFGPTALEKIKNLQEGEVLMLENLRFLAEEAMEKNPAEHSKDYFIQKLASTAQVFVNDAFSSAHRSHASMVGFTPLLPSFAGRAMEKELKASEKLLNGKRHCVLLIGGVKFKETLDIIEAMCTNGRAEHVLTTGSLALLFLKAKGLSLGEETEDSLTAMQVESYLQRAKQLVDMHRDKIITPLDFAVEEDAKRKEYMVTDLPVQAAIKDIGARTAQAYAGVIANAGCVFAKGAAGEFEDVKFRQGTKAICQALVQASGFTVLAGGSLLSAFDLFVLDKGKISHVSTAGGALLEYLACKKLAGVEALRKS